MSVAQIAVSKLGYGILAECAANGAGVLFPPRHGFREDEILSTEGRRFIRMREIPLIDYEAGRWIDHLRDMATVPAPTERLEFDGAKTCASILLKELDEGHMGSRWSP